MLQLNIDCEGPITRNDNAFEMCGEFIPGGDKIFSIVSRYDDFLADVEKRPGYKAGDTLKLVLPFLKAYGVTDRLMEDFSRETLVMLPGTELMLPEVNRMLPSFIISTSYRPYLDALCMATGFPVDNVFCTDVSLDKYSLGSEEAEYLKRTASEIVEMEMLEWPGDAAGIEDVPARHRKTIERLDRIFWKEISSMRIGRIFNEVNPVGGVEKANAVRESLKRTGLSLRNIIYAGDSITDVHALELVRSGGGVGIAFNGNRYAIKAAKWAVLSSSTLVIAGLCRLLLDRGIGILNEIPVDGKGEMDCGVMVREMKSAGAGPESSAALDELVHKRQFHMFMVEVSEQEALVEKSERFRKGIRGHRIGQLG